MKKTPQWIADIDSSKVNVIKVVQAMIAGKPGKYMLNQRQSNGNPYVVGIYFSDNVFTQGRLPQSRIVGYLDN